MCWGGGYIMCAQRTHRAVCLFVCSYNVISPLTDSLKLKRVCCCFVLLVSVSASRFMSDIRSLFLRHCARSCGGCEAGLQLLQGRCFIQDRHGQKNPQILSHSVKCSFNCESQSRSVSQTAATSSLISHFTGEKS